MSAHVVILLASYQGGEHIDAQLDSIARQTHADWSLIVSDDGSRDDTCAVVRDFAGRMRPGQVQLVQGPAQGATANFLTLLDHAPRGAMIAFCDQDDHWLPQKLEWAVEYLSRQNGPAHYAARTIITDRQLRPLTQSRYFPRPLGFRNAVVQAIMAGNTSVFNAAAADLLRQGAPFALKAGVLSHDWWAYQLTSGVGAAMWHDPRPALLYRQHDRAEVGRNDTLPALVARLRKLLVGDFGAWMAANHAAVVPMQDHLTAQNRDILHRVDKMLSQPGPKALLTMRQAGLYRQTRPGNAALAATVAAGRLRRR